MDRFERISTEWAEAKLASRGTLNGRTVKSVDFVQEHSSCWGHEDYEYCYCDTSSWVEVWVHFTDKSYVQLFPEADSPVRWDLGRVIRELVDFR